MELKNQEKTMKNLIDLIYLFLNLQLTGNFIINVKVKIFLFSNFARILV
jgi:hypothetical protein